MGCEVSGTRCQVLAGEGELTAALNEAEQGEVSGTRCQVSAGEREGNGLPP